MPVAVERREYAKALVDRAVRAAIRSTGDGTKESLRRLLAAVRGRSELLHPARLVGRAEPGQLDAMVGGLAALAHHHKTWRRNPEGWEPVGENPRPLFSSLAHHLLADYPVPPVLLSAWFLGTDWQARRMQGWFAHAGRGDSLRTAGLPITLTRRMAHEFAGAPARFPIKFALRWAQAVGLGASDDLARAIASTRLGREFAGHAFWPAGILFFLNNPGLSPDEMDLLVEYVHDQRFVARVAIVGEDTEVTLDPPQPDFTFRGRTVASLLRRASAWKLDRDDQPRRQSIRWDPQPIAGYRKEDGLGNARTIRELLDADALAAEGKALDHCVAEYVNACRKGFSSIWSLGLEGPEGRARLATIEVNPATREVVQASMKDNDALDPACRAMIVDWSVREGLKFEADE